jgi:CO/xanthine dehydrogenase Mo-binding subunit
MRAPGEAVGLLALECAMDELAEKLGLDPAELRMHNEPTQDARQHGRYRWSVYENMKVRDTSFYSFTTRREAQADADKFVEKLKAIWQPH